MAGGTRATIHFRRSIGTKSWMKLPRWVCRQKNGDIAIALRSMDHLGWDEAWSLRLCWVRDLAAGFPGEVGVDTRDLYVSGPLACAARADKALLAVGGIRLQLAQCHILVRARRHDDGTEILGRVGESNLEGHLGSLREAHRDEPAAGRGELVSKPGKSEADVGGVACGIFRPDERFFAARQGAADADERHVQVVGILLIHLSEHKPARFGPEPVHSHATSIGVPG